MPALEGVTILDLTQGICGPFATQQLGDLGARVIKVEPPGGDYGRQFGPPFIGGESAVWLNLNRNKESIVLDYATSDAREDIIKLAMRADVVVEDLGPGVAEELGIGYETLSSGNAELIYCALSAFGERGPWRDRLGSEVVIQAMSEYLSGQGVIGEPPTRLGFDVAAVHTAVFCVQGVLAALYSLGNTGEGQRLAVSSFGVLMHQRGAMWVSQSDPDEWYGHHLDAFTMPRVHGCATKDRPIYFNLQRGDESSWVSLLQELDILDVVTDPRFDDVGREAVGLGRYAQEVRHIWEGAFQGRTAAEVIDLISRHDGFATVMNDYDDLFASAQFDTLNLAMEIDHPTAGTFQAVGPPWEMEGVDRTRAGTRPPRLGEHTNDVLAWLADIDAGNGALGSPEGSD